MRILLTGATGYLGGRLAPRLLERGHDVRVLVRDRSRLRDVPWADDVEVVEGDLDNLVAARPCPTMTRREQFADVVDLSR
ncbi:MAG: hypothetical protein CMF56_06025, partial [Leifsonia sp.]|nr:hypothetical protein [Leifsonia sp.]